MAKIDYILASRSELQKRPLAMNSEILICEYSNSLTDGLVHAAGGSGGRHMGEQHPHHVFTRILAKQKR